MICFKKLHYLISMLFLSYLTLAQNTDLSDYLVSFASESAKNSTDVVLNSVSSFQEYLVAAFNNILSSKSDELILATRNKTIQSVSQIMPNLMRVSLHSKVADVIRSLPEIESIELNQQLQVNSAIPVSGANVANQISALQRSARSLLLSDQQQKQASDKAVNKPLDRNLALSNVSNLGPSSSSRSFAASLDTAGKITSWNIQMFPPWQLGKISFEGNDNSNLYPYGQEYYEPKPQNDVVVYVIDSGVDDTIEELAGRVETGKNFVPDEPDHDIFGHGTAIAGAIAGKLNGASKNAKIVSIKVLSRNNTGRLYDFVDSLNWAIDHKKKKYPNTPALINFSINLISSSKVLEGAFKTVFDAGILSIASAGNQARDACHYSPSGSEFVITTGSFTPQNTFDSNFSNYGKCIDILAPGIDIVSAKLNRPSDSLNDVQPFTGTSFAAAVVSGVAASLLSVYPNLSPSELKGRILSAAIKNQITNMPQDTVNARLWNGYQGPTSSITYV